MKHYDFKRSWKTMIMALILMPNFLLAHIRATSMDIILPESFVQTSSCSGIAHWSDTNTYTQGDEVQFNSTRYVANWWTQDNPETHNGGAGSGQPWTIVGSCTGGNQAPVVNISSPVAGAAFVAGHTISIAAIASDADGTVTQVEFLADGSSLGLDASSPYTLDWNGAVIGNHSLTAIATDDQGATTTSGSVSISVNSDGGNPNLPPTVSLSSPAEGATFNTGDPITISANASDSDGVLTQVEFFANGNSIGADSTSPYSIDWSNAPDGNYALTAIATDDDQATTTSSIINITVGQPGNGNAMSFDNLPLQINLNEGTTETFSFDAAISGIISRNIESISYTINGSEVTITGLKAGRTGLRITSAGQDYFMGLRVNKPNGAVPGLPQHVSIGSVSENTTTDMAFWQDIDTDMTNKAMDIRYIYINEGPSGPFSGWRKTNPQRVIQFCTESMRMGLIPFFIYYNIPDGGESFDTDLAHIQSVEYMNAYFEDLNIFLSQAQDIMGDELRGIILEPDFLGYMQQLGELRLGTNDPDQISTVVNGNTIAPGAGTISTLVNRINQVINQKRVEGHNIFYGWQLNLWAYAPTSGSKGVLRRTDDDDLGFTAGRLAIQEAAQQTALYAMDAECLSHGADFLSIDKYGLDAAGVPGANPDDPSGTSWYFNNDHWFNYLYYVENLKQTSGLPIVLWQLPVGHLNTSSYISAYTGSAFAPLPNTSARYEDPTTTFFFGDTFSAGNSTRSSYFSQNQYSDSKLQVSGSTITWGNHMQEVKDAGVIVALFGAGVGASTDGVGTPPTDDYFWIQKVQDYYANGPIPLDTEYGSGDRDLCVDGCAPAVIFSSPVNNSNVILEQLEAITIELTSYDLDGTVSNLALTANGQTVSTSVLGDVYTASWTPAAFGEYVITAVATDNAGQSTTQSVTFTLEQFDPVTCNNPVWNANTTYPDPTTVAHDGRIWRNKWWTQNEIPGTPDGPWEDLGVCNGPAGARVAAENKPEGRPRTIEIFPNPSGAIFYIELNGYEGLSEITASIYNLQGKRLKSVTVDSSIQRLQINASDLPEGIYFLTVHSAAGELAMTRKVIRE